MKKRLALLAFLLFSVALLGSCVHNYTMKPDTPKTTYLKARLEFNTLLCQYLDYYDRAPKEVQEKWKKEIDPLFKEADLALNMWRDAIKGGVSDEEAMKRYLRIKNQLIDALVPIFNEEE